MRRLYVSSKFLVAVIAVSTVFSLSGYTRSAMAQSSIEIFQDKLSALEEGLKEVRGVVEEDFRALKQSLEDNEGVSSDELRDLDNKIGKLVDQIGALNNRIERTLQVATDNEFRLLRLEKRIESMMRMGLDNAISQSGPVNQGAGDAPQSSLSSNENNQANWTIGEETLNNEISKLPNPEDAATETAVASEGDSANAATEEAVAQEETVTAVAAEVEVASVLPDAAPDEQYRFALGKALQNDLDMAELALDEFVRTNPEHERANDAMFWLGRVQFMKSSYEKAAMTFTSFNSQWPTDSRREKTTLWIAESISYFAPTEEVCDLLVSLPNLIEDPTDNFFQRLEKLKTKAECSG